MYGVNVTRALAPVTCTCVCVSAVVGVLQAGSEKFSIFGEKKFYNHRFKDIGKWHQNVSLIVSMA